MANWSVVLWVMSAVAGVLGGCIPGYLFAVFLQSGEPLALVYALMCLAIFLAAPVIAGSVYSCKQEKHRARRRARHRHRERPITTAELDDLEQ